VEITEPIQHQKMAMGPWYDAKEFEAHVRSSGGLSVLDLTVATSQHYGGFSSFTKAASK
jgi:hypothetical protein